MKIDPVATEDNPTTLDVDSVAKDLAFAKAWHDLVLVCLDFMTTELVSKVAASIQQSPTPARIFLLRRASSSSKSARRAAGKEHPIILSKNMLCLLIKVRVVFIYIL
jgi:hypothetical protein